MGGHHLDHLSGAVQGEGNDGNRQLSEKRGHYSSFPSRLSVSPTGNRFFNLGRK